MWKEFANWKELLVHYLKRDRKMLIIWIVCMSVFSGGFVLEFVEISKGGGLAAYFEIMKNPAMISMAGTTPVRTAADYTIGAMYAQMMLLFCGLFAMIIAAIHVTAHTRKEEESGLTEFLCTYRVGRHANLLALLVEMLLVHGIMLLLTGGMMCVFQEKSMPAGGCFLFAAAVGLAGMMGAVMAMAVAQIMPTAGAATGVSLGIMGLLYLLRGGTDISHKDLSMLNPMGWIYMTFPFTKNDFLPLLYCIVFGIIMFFIAVLLEKNRDMGEGYLKESMGNGKVKKSLLSVPGLLMRLNRGTIAGWLISFAVLGAAYGSVYGDMEKFLNSNEIVRAMFVMQGVSMEESFTSVILVVMMCITSVLPVVIVNKLFAEEQNSHLEQVFATKVSRAKLYFTTVIISCAAAAVGILLSAGSLGVVGIACMTKSSMDIGDVLAGGFHYFPAQLFMTALSACIVGWMPGLRKVTYVYICYSFMLSYFQGILKLPEWFEKTAIFSWIPRMPGESFDAGVFIGVSLVSLCMIALGYVGYRRRDLLL